MRGRRCASCGFDYRAHLAVLPAHAFSVVNVKGEDMLRILYARIDSTVHGDLLDVARRAGLSVAKVVETIASTALGHRHPYAPVVAGAIKLHKEGAP